MRLLAGFLVAGALGVALHLSGVDASRSRPTSCTGLCAQDVATAVYAGWNQLDCDDVDAPTSSCNDELNDVNRTPQVEAVTRDKHGVTVRLRVFLKGGPGSLVYEAQFDKGGRLTKFQ